MPDIKLIAVDLDDTLLKNDLTIAPSCQAVLREAVSQGVVVTIATGRMFCSARRYAEELGIRGVPLVLYQGAWVRTLEGDEIYRRPLQLDDARDIIEAMRGFDCHYQTYLNDELYMERLTPEAEQYARMSSARIHVVDDLRQTLGQEPLKFVVIDYDFAALDKVEQELRALLGDRITIVRSKPQFLEMSHRQATKAYALEAVAHHYGIKREEVMAVGDSYSDMDMLEWAGVGVAMANAWDEVKASADFVTFSNEEDGVAEAVRRFVLKA